MTNVHLCNYTIIKTQNICLTPESLSCLFAVNPHPHSRQPMISFLSPKLSSARFRTSHKLNLITICTFLCLVSFAQVFEIHSLSCLSPRRVPFFLLMLLFLSLLLTNIPLYDHTTTYLSFHLLMGIWIVMNKGVTDILI